MNCEECKEQVLDLIEREALDPEGIRETLAKCPECRAEFDEVKAMLAVANQLPLEAPPDHLDILILQAAEARTAGVAPAIETLVAEQPTVATAPRAEARPQLSLWRPPWAMAAVALLVVGIGISTVSIVRGPGQEPVAEAPAAEEGEQRTPQLDDVAVAAGTPEPERLELAAASTEQEVAREAAAARPSTRQARARRPRSTAKKEARAAGRGAPGPTAADEEPQRLAVAEADQAAKPPAEQYDAAELPALKSDESKAARSFGQANGPRGATTEEERQCRSTILVFEKRRKDNPSFKPTPQQALEAGLCYQLRGNRAEAARWLKRATEHPSTKRRATEALEKLE